MRSSGEIHYLRNHEIDRARWDMCLSNSDNELIYGYSFYLDAMCDNWDALVLDDYKMVMPLPWRKKYTIHYLYQPFFVPALGVFGKNLSEGIIGQFLNVIPSKFQYWDQDLNEGNQLFDHTGISNLKVSSRKNMFLKLKPYDVLFSNYSSILKRKLRKANSEELTIIKDVPADIVIDHYINEYELKNRIIPDSNYTTLKRTLSIFKNDNLRTYIALSKEDEIVGFYLAYIDNNFVYSLLGGSTEKGKKQGTFGFLIDAVIKDNSGSEKIFRFEGSDIPGIAFFNQQFGAYFIEYLHLKRNNLPKPIRWLKQ